MKREKAYYSLCASTSCSCIANSDSRSSISKGLPCASSPLVLCSTKPCPTSRRERPLTQTSNSLQNAQYTVHAQHSYHGGRRQFCPVHPTPHSTFVGHQPSESFLYKILRALHSHPYQQTLKQTHPLLPVHDALIPQNTTKSGGDHLQNRKHAHQHSFRTLWGAHARPPTRSPSPLSSSQTLDSSQHEQVPSEGSAGNGWEGRCMLLLLFYGIHPVFMLPQQRPEVSL